MKFNNVMLGLALSFTVGSNIEATDEQVRLRYLDYLKGQPTLVCAVRDQGNAKEMPAGLTLQLGDGRHKMRWVPGAIAVVSAELDTVLDTYSELTVSGEDQDYLYRGKASSNWIDLRVVTKSTLEAKLLQGHCGYFEDTTITNPRYRGDEHVRLNN